MKVGDIMNRTPVTATATQTFADAFRILVESRSSNVPVIDENGVFQGNFDLVDVWRVFLPKATQLSRKSIEDLAFVSSSLEKLQEQVREAGPAPIKQFLNQEDAPAIYADSSLMQAILLLEEHGETLAVIDRTTRKLVGTVSPWDVLDPVRKQ